VSANHSVGEVDVEDGKVVTVSVATTDAVMPVVRARRAHLLESSLLNCKSCSWLFESFANDYIAEVALDVELAAVELLQLLKRLRLQLDLHLDKKSYTYLERLG
jgi:hypothetical protein